MKTHTRIYPRSLPNLLLSNFAFNVCLAWVKMVVLAKGFGWNEYVRPRVFTVLLLTSMGTQDHLASQTKVSIQLLLKAGKYYFEILNIGKTSPRPNCRKLYMGSSESSWRMHIMGGNA